MYNGKKKAFSTNGFGKTGKNAKEWNQTTFSHCLQQKPPQNGLKT